MGPWRSMTAVVVATVVLWSGAAWVQTALAACDPGRIPPQIEGQVVKVDAAQGKVTVRTTDGTMHEFQASQETLQDSKAGDQIKAKLRKSPPLLIGSRRSVWTSWGLADDTGVPKRLRPALVAPRDLLHAPMSMRSSLDPRIFYARASSWTSSVPSTMDVPHGHVRSYILARTFSS